MQRLFGSVQKILQHVVGRLFVARETFGELAASLRHRTQACGVSEKFALRRFRRDHLHAVLRIHADDAPAPFVQIAHDVADVLLGNGDLEVRERLQQDGIGVFDALFEGDLRRRLERRFGGVDGVETSVVQRCLHVNDGVTRKHAVGQAFHETFFNGGNVLFGHGAAHHFVHKFEIFFARFEADLAVTVLSVSARLLLVLAFDVRFAADGLLIGDRGGAELGIRAEFCLELFLDDVKMDLSLSSHERFARVGVLADGKALVLFGKAVESAEYLVFRAAHRRIDRHEEDGPVEGDGIEHDGRILCAQRVARARVGQFADRADVARAQLRERFELLAADQVDGADAFRRVRVGIEHAHAGFEAPAHDAQIVHLTHKGIDGGLEDLRRKGTVRIAGDAHDGVLCQVGRGLFGALCCLGQVLDDLVHQVDDALVLQCAARHDGNDVDVEDALADAVDHVLA